MDRLFVIVIIIFIFFLLLTYLLHRFFQRRKIIKYIPAVISLIIALINMYIAGKAQGEGFSDLGRVIIAMLLIAGFFSGLMCGLYFDYIAPRFRK